MSRQVSIDEFLTIEEIAAALALYTTAAPGTFARRCAEEIIEPVLPRIEAKLGQQCLARYLAYMVELTFLKVIEEGNKS